MFSKRTDWKLTPNHFTEVQRELLAAGREILDLTVSNPTRAGLPYDTETILNSLAHPQAMDYDPQPKGLRSAREAVAAYYGEQVEPYAVGPESLVLTTSTSEGYSYVLGLLCNPNDEILVPKPSYPLFEFLADLEDVKLVPYPLLYDHGWQIDFPSLDRAVNPRTRAVVIVHPNNPTGSYVDGAERDDLNVFCRQHHLALIVDEVFLDYAHDGAPRSTFAMNQETLTFTLSGLSKISGLPQMKLAWLAVSGPPGQVDTALARLEIVADTYLSMNAPIQLAAPVLLDQRKRLAAAAPRSFAFEFVATGSRVGTAEDLPAHAHRGWMVRRAASAGDPVRRRVSGRTAAQGIPACPSRPLLRLPDGWIPGGEPDDSSPTVS